MTSEGTERSFPAGPEDREVAEWLAGELRNKIKYNYATKAWHVWNDIIWAPDKTREAMQIVFDLIRDRHAKLAQWTLDGSVDSKAFERATKLLRPVLNKVKCEAVLAALATMSGYKTDGAEWDQVSWLLGCKNGIVDLRTGELDEHPSPTCMVTKSTNIAYNPHADAKRFITFLDEVTSGDAELATFYLRWFGYCLFGLTTEQRFLILLGAGRNGKGALVHVIRHVFGDYASPAQSGLYMKNRMGSARSNEARSDLIQLKGSRIAIMSEPEGGRFNEELLKAHTGGDPIVARPLFGQEIAWEPTHTITFLTNRPPSVDDIGPSMQARVLVADFRERYDAGFNKPDLRLYDKLVAEGPGVLRWLVQAAGWWWRNARDTGMPVPERVIRASEVYITENDPIGHALASRFVFEAGARVQARAAYEAYLLWHREEDESDSELLSLTAFGLLLKSRGVGKKTGETGVMYRGLRLKSAVEIAESEVA